MKSLRIGYSTCTNDTYILGGISAWGKDTFQAFDPVLADVETLNQLALEGKLDVTKLSFFALGSVR